MEQAISAAVLTAHNMPAYNFDQSHDSFCILRACEGTPLGALLNGISSCISATHMGDKDWILGCCIYPDLAQAALDFVVVDSG